MVVYMPQPPLINYVKPCATNSIISKKRRWISTRSVATNVYLDDLSDTPKFDDVYIQYFNHILPARTTIEQ